MMANDSWRKESMTYNQYLWSSSLNYGNASDTDLPDLVEEDIWSTMSHSTPNDYNHHDLFDRSGNNSNYRGEQRRKKVNGDDCQIGGLSLVIEDNRRSSPLVINQLSISKKNNHQRHPTRASAPVSVPDWPRVYHVNSNEFTHGSVDTQVELDDMEWMPPHEYLARENSTSGKATSVFEGVGRTLKGRDLSRVREAVWHQTRFFG